MNITIVNQHVDDKMGGSELQCHFIAYELTKLGHQIFYIAINGSNKNYNTDYQVITCNKNIDEMFSSIANTRPDIVYWRYNKNFFYETVKKLNKNKIPVIFAASSLNDVRMFTHKTGESLRKIIFRFFDSIKQHRGMKYVSAVTVNNEEYLGWLPVTKQKFIPNGMDDASIPFDWLKPYCCWIGSLKRIKRPEIFVKLSEQFKDSGIDFLMIGEVQEKNYNWIPQSFSEGDGNLHYLGFQNPYKVNGILKNSLFHVHTCLTEGFPNVFIQAWMQGKPTVSLGFDPANYITNYELGFFSENNMEIFYKQVEIMIRDKDCRHKLGSNAKLFSDKMFSIENNVKNLNNFIKSINES